MQSMSGGAFNPERLKTTYLYIDGNYLSSNYKKRISRWFDGKVEIDFHQIKQDFKAKKAFYYDCLGDIQRSSETQTEYNKRLENQKAAFDRIRELQGYHVRQGVVAGGNARSFRQKEVDILLTVDMLTHAFNKTVDNAVLLTGDRDFKPLVETLVQLGIDVTIVSDPMSTTTDFGYAADSWRKIEFENYWGWTTNDIRSQYLRPDVHGMTESPLQLGWELKKKGKWDSMNIELYFGANQYCLFCKDKSPAYSRDFLYTDLEKLELFFELKFGKIEWI